jgi:molybdate transport system substrate-binding protein
MNRMGGIAAAMLAASLCGAQAAELNCLFPGGVKAATGVLVPQFEKSSGNKVTIKYMSAGGVADQVREGAAADVAISTEKSVEELETQGKIVSGSKTAIAKVGVAVFVKKGAPKPDIRSVDAFKRSLLAAKSIAYTNPNAGGPAGKYVGGLIEKLGLAPEMTPKTRLTGPGEAVAKAVLSGEAEFGFLMISEILSEPELDMVGPLPAEIQFFTRFSAGILAASKEQETAKVLLVFLTSPAAKTVIKSKGYELF